MANEFSDYESLFGEGVARPDWLASMDNYRTPKEDWARLTSQTQPFWSTRAPLEDLGERLRARYLLGAPEMATLPNVSPTFSQYLQDYPGSYTGETPQMYSAGYNPTTGSARTAAGSLAELQNRARQAAMASVTAPGAYMEETPPGEPGSAEQQEFNRRAWLSAQFSGAGGEQSQNRMRVANLLALQRSGGGAYTGTMANAIRNAMNNLYQQRLNTGAPRESFLNWYVSQVAPQQAQT